MNKPIFVALVTLLVAGSSLRAQDNCEAYFPFKAGVTMEFVSYDKKDKASVTATHRVDKLETSGSGLTAEVSTRLVDKKGKEVHQGSYKVTCRDNVLYMDMTGFLPAEMNESFQKMEATVEGDGLTLPSRLEVGQTLPDATTTIKLNSAGLANLMNMTMSITDRKVESKETITTPAGSFECYKITYQTYTKALIGRTFRSATWYAKDIGAVKTENYDNKGNLEGYTLLTRLEK